VLGRTLALARMGSEPQPDAVGDVATRLGELAAEIDQMLVVVRRSREQMHGRSRMDELGDHLRAMDDAPEDPGTGLGTREQLG
jgi:hypothetical protein